MKLTIEDPQSIRAIPNSYSVEIKVMGGDADYYDSFTVNGFEPNRDEALLENLLRLLGRIDSFYPSGRGGSWAYSLTKVPGFEAWFSELDTESYGLEEPGEYSFKFESEEQKSELRKLAQDVAEFYDRVFEKADSLGLKGTNYDNWPGDATTDHEIECDYESHQVFYYDEHRVKHPVTVEL